MVEAAARSGFKFISGSEIYRKLDVMGQEQDFQILHNFEFNSDRKRMSVIAKGPDGIIKLYVKGADSIIKARLEPNEPQPFLDANQEALHNFSRKGLRTLLVAMRIIEPSEYKDIEERYEQISHLSDKEALISNFPEIS